MHYTLHFHPLVHSVSFLNTQNVRKFVLLMIPREGYKKGPFDSNSLKLENYYLKTSQSCKFSN